MKNELRGFHNKIDWVSVVWMQDSWVLLKLDSISWRKTLENNFMQWPVVNTLFQEMMDHLNRKDGFMETQTLDPCWKSRLVACMVNMESRLKFWSLSEDNTHSWVTISHGSNNLWWTRTTTTQKFLKICLKNKRYNWRCKILHAEQRQKQNRLKKRPVVIQRASFRWMKGTGLVLKQEILSAYEVS